MASKLFNREFWESTIENAVIAGAGVLATSWAVTETDIPVDIDPSASATMFLGVVIAHIVKSLALPNLGKTTGTSTNESPGEATPRRGRHSKR